MKNLETPGKTGRVGRYASMCPCQPIVFHSSVVTASNLFSGRSMVPLGFGTKHGPLNLDPLFFLQEIHSPDLNN